MRLTCQGPQLCVGEGMCHRLGGGRHERGTRSPSHNQDGNGNGCQPLCGDSAILHDGIIVGQRRRYRLKKGPDRHLAHPGHCFSRRAPRRHGERGRIPPASLAEQRPQLSRVALRCPARLLVTGVERRLIQGQSGDRKTARRRVKGQYPCTGYLKHPF